MGGATEALRDKPAWSAAIAPSLWRACARRRGEGAPRMASKASQTRRPASFWSLGAHRRGQARPDRATGEAGHRALPHPRRRSGRRGREGARDDHLGKCTHFYCHRPRHGDLGRSLTPFILIGRARGLGGAGDWEARGTGRRGATGTAWADGPRSCAGAQEYSWQAT